MANFIDFHVGGWKVGSISASAGIFVGENLQYGWRDTGKQNQASRNITGDGNHIIGATNIIDDPDMMDTWIQHAAPFTQVRPPSPALVGMMAKRRREIHHMSAPEKKRNWDGDWMW